jgi:hypothetical protein
MKKIQLSFIAMLLLGAVACKKNGSSPSMSSNVSNAEAADMVAGSISRNSNGVANVSDDATANAAVVVSTHVACGTIRSDTISRKSPAGSPVTFSYNLTYNFTVNCSNNVPDNLASSLIYSGSFSGPHISSSNSGSSIFTVTGLLPAATTFVLNGEYKRAGTFQSKIDTTNHGNSNVDIVVTALTVTKSTRTIASGNASISVTGSVPKKGSFSYTGTLVFNGDGTATLTLNGTVYTINLADGTRIRV